MFVRTHTPLPLRIWARNTAIRFVLYAVVPALVFAWITVRAEMRTTSLDLTPHTPSVVAHETH
jgi:hypothetical protein